MSQLDKSKKGKPMITRALGAIKKKMRDVLSPEHYKILEAEIKTQLDKYNEVTKNYKPVTEDIYITRMNANAPRKLAEGFKADVCHIRDNTKWLDPYTTHVFMSYAKIAHKHMSTPPVQAVKEKCGVGIIHPCCAILLTGKRRGLECGKGAKHKYKGKHYCGTHAKKLEDYTPLVVEEKPKKSKRSKNDTEEKDELVEVNIMNEIPPEIKARVDEVYRKSEEERKERERKAQEYLKNTTPEERAAAKQAKVNALREKRFKRWGTYDYQEACRLSVEKKKQEEAKKKQEEDEKRKKLIIEIPKSEKTGLSPEDRKKAYEILRGWDDPNLKFYETQPTTGNTPTETKPPQDFPVAESKPKPKELTHEEMMAQNERIAKLHEEEQANKPKPDPSTYVEVVPQGDDLFDPRTKAEIERDKKEQENKRIIEEAINKHKDVFSSTPFVEPTPQVVKEEPKPKAEEPADITKSEFYLRQVQLIEEQRKLDELCGISKEERLAIERDPKDWLSEYE